MPDEKLRLGPDGRVELDTPEPPPYDDGSLPAHLEPAAIAACTLCDEIGYRGNVVCDHREHATPETRAAAMDAIRAALGKGAR